MEKIKTLQAVAYVIAVALAFVFAKTCLPLLWGALAQLANAVRVMLGMGSVL